MTGRSRVIAEQLSPAPSLLPHAGALQPRLLGGHRAAHHEAPAGVEGGSVAEAAGVLSLRLQLQMRLDVVRASLAAGLLAHAGCLSGGC